MKNYFLSLLVSLQNQRTRERDKHIISAVREAINEGFNTKSKLSKEVKERTCESLSRVKGVIKQREGSNYALGDRWSVKRGDNNSQIFSILPHPLNIK